MRPRSSPNSGRPSTRSGTPARLTATGMVSTIGKLLLRSSRTSPRLCAHGSRSCATPWPATRAWPLLPRKTDPDSRESPMQSTIQGKAYVLGDNVDTDQIIPAQYLTLNPAVPEEYRQFGKYALSSVPAAQAGL